jgi:XTP/dITP diphosphohydrolase
MSRIILASSNKGKLVELARLLPGHDVVGLPDGFVELPETGATFAQNAMVKAQHAAAVTGEVSVGDDSGFVVDALNGMPGLLSARWAGRHGDDAANLALVLAQLSDVPDDRRRASFVCAAAVATPDGAGEVVHGVIQGTVLRAPRGDKGFGYDPLFVPFGHTRTTAEMDPDEKDAISHRGQAMRLLVPRLQALVS